jgi:ubiquinone/menaquinone biosynthesis C-methylase UbiE
MNKKIAQKLIQKNKEDYNRIAHHFSSTRKYNWPNMVALLSDIKTDKNFKMADLGCGNGRLYELIKAKNIDYYGLDLSEDLIKIAKKNHPEAKFEVGSILETPYKDNFFDLTVSVATLHHIPSKENRQAALNEIYRITKPGGKVIITNWYFWDKSKHLKAISKEALRILLGKSELDFGDFFMPWKSVHGNTLVNRYFHAWRKSELVKGLKKAGFSDIKVIERSEYKSKDKQETSLMAICHK